MMESKEFTGKNVEEALENALKELNVSIDQINYEVIEKESGGFLGLLGGKPAKIVVTVRENETETVTVKEEKDLCQVAITFLNEVLNAAFDFSDTHNRQLMIEYILLGKKDDNGIVSLYNATEEHALKLAELLHGHNVMVNLIPWNSVDERDFASLSGNAVHRFQDILIKNGIHTRIRRERGADIGSACGQLRLKNKKETI